MAERGEAAPKSAESFPVPVRVFLLIVAASLTLAAALLVSSSALLLAPISQLPASALLVCLIALAQWRSPLLALLCALVPLIGCFWSVALFGALLRLLPTPFFAGPFAFGAVLSILCADRFALRALADEEAHRAALGLYGAMAAASTAALAPFLATALLACFAIGDQRWMLAASDAIAAGVTCAAVFLLLPALVALFRVDDSFVTRTNRLLERRTILAYRLTLVATPQWAVSVAGIAVVVAVVGWFGGASVVLGDAIDLRLLLLAVGLSFLAILSLTGAWRAALGSAFSLVVVGLIGLWAWVRLAPVAAAATARLDDCMAVASLLVVFLAARTRRYAKTESLDVARTRAIEETSAPISFAALAGLVAFLPSVRAPQALLAIVMVIAGVVAALVFAPAAAAALETLLPARRPVEELYGKRAG